MNYETIRPDVSTTAGLLDTIEEITKTINMENIDRKAAKEIVKQALSEVADFSGDFENFTFEQFHPFHKKVFLNSLKNRTNKTVCFDHTGGITHEEYFDLELSLNILSSWRTMKDCIDYIADYHYRRASKTGKIQFP